MLLYLGFSFFLGSLFFGGAVCYVSFVVLVFCVLIIKFSAIDKKKSVLPCEKIK